MIDIETYLIQTLTAHPVLIPLVEEMLNTPPQRIAEVYKDFETRGKLLLLQEKEQAAGLVSQTI